MSQPHLLSASRVELARHCVAWLAPGVEWDEKSTYAQRIGTAVHWAIEQWLKAEPFKLPMRRIVSDAGDEFDLTAKQCDKVQEFADAWEAWTDMRPWLIDAIVGVEVPYAYDPETRTARRLERGEHREYKGAQAHEIVCTVDAEAELGEWRLPIDWKCGGFGLPAPTEHPQLCTNAFIVGRAHNAPVAGMLTALRPGGSWHEWDDFSERRLALFEGELLEIHERRKLGEAPRPGAHCDKCPAIRTCEAKNKGKRKKL